MGRGKGSPKEEEENSSSKGEERPVNEILSKGEDLLEKEISWGVENDCLHLLI